MDVLLKINLKICTSICRFSEDYYYSTTSDTGINSSSSIKLSMLLPFIWHSYQCLTEHKCISTKVDNLHVFFETFLQY